MDMAIAAKMALSVLMLTTRSISILHIDRANSIGVIVWNKYDAVPWHEAFIMCVHYSSVPHFALSCVTIVQVAVCQHCYADKACSTDYTNAVRAGFLVQSSGLQVSPSHYKYHFQ